MRKASVVAMLTMAFAVSTGACGPDKITGATENVAQDRAAPPASYAAPSSTGSGSIAAPDDPRARRKCRWVIGHGLVCDTPISTVNI